MTVLSARLTPGAMFTHDFRVVRPLAAGGMGEIYVVEQLSTGKLRALKLMQPHLVAGPASVARFRREARVAARIESDHVVDVIGAGIDERSGVPWLAMELLAGEDLGALLKRRARLPAAEVRELFVQLCHALAAAHRGGIVHRDIKPENVFIAEPRRPGARFTVKVLDFGIAKLTQETATASLGTPTGGMVGSPFWMAPEQCEGGAAITPATDVWALGLLAFRALAGRRFWRAANAATFSPTAVLSEMLLTPIPRATERAAELGVDAALPPGFDAWFAGCVARSAARRFADASAAMRELDPVLRAAPAGEEDAALDQAGGAPLDDPGARHSITQVEPVRDAGREALDPVVTVRARR